MEPRWSELFGDLGGEPLDQLLTWADAAPSDLPSDPTGGARPWRMAAAAGDGADDGVLGAAVAAIAAAPADRFADRLAALSLVGDVPALHARGVDVARSVVSEEVRRPLVALLAHDAAAGRTTGATPQERYDAWLAALLAPAGWARVERTHPDLLPRAVALAEQRLAALADLVERTDRYWSGIAADLGLDPTARLVDLQVGGDSHGGGRCVAVLRTSAGERLVAKPRPARVEEGYGSFASWLGEAAGVAVGDAALPRPRFHHAGDSAWMEHLPGLTSAGGRHAAYFTQVGVHLAALHLLRGTDVHYENLLADGAGRPAVIDAEALFTPRLGAREDLDVAATGLLSVPFGDAAFDFGALDYRAGGASPFRAWHVEGPGRDDLRLVMRPVVVDHPEVAPGARTGAEARAVEEAFAAVLDHVVEHRATVLGRLEATFRSGRVRLIHRATMTYALLLRTATHPSFASDRDRQRVFARLAVMAPATDPAVLASEVRQLTAGEIPAFEVDLHDPRVRDARGRDTGARAAVAPYEDVVELVTRLDADHVARQVAVLRSRVGHWGAAPAAPAAPGAPGAPGAQAPQ